MDENMKYYKLSGEGIEANVVVACKPDEVERLFKKYEGYTLEETECPQDAHIMKAQPPIPGMDIYMQEYRMINSMMYGYPKKRRVMFDAPKCAKCLNRYGKSNRQRDWCSRHWQEEKCYRFKLER